MKLKEYSNRMLTDHLTILVSEYADNVDVGLKAGTRFNRFKQTEELHLILMGLLSVFFFRKVARVRSNLIAFYGLLNNLFGDFFLRIICSFGLEIMNGQLLFVCVVSIEPWSRRWTYPLTQRLL